jgi:hypothetical protein
MERCCRSRVDRAAVVFCMEVIVVQNVSVMTLSHSFRYFFPKVAALLDSEEISSKSCSKSSKGSKIQLQF